MIVQAGERASGLRSHRQHPPGGAAQWLCESSQASGPRAEAP